MSERICIVEDCEDLVACPCCEKCQKHHDQSMGEIEYDY